MSNEPYALGEVNVDSLKESLLFLSTVFPFVDETAKEAFTNQVNGLDSGTNPHEETVVGDPIAPIVAVDSTEETGETTSTATDETVTPGAGDTTTENPDETVTPEGASAMPAATATEPSAETTTAADSSAAHIADLEAQLAAAKAAAGESS